MPILFSDDVINKADIADPEIIQEILRQEESAISISVHTGLGMKLLKAMIEETLPTPSTPIAVLIPYSLGNLVSKIHERGEIDEEAYHESGTLIRGRVDENLAHQLKEFLL